MDKQDLKNLAPQQPIQFRLRESIDERFDLSAIPQLSAGATLLIGCGDVKRLNSSGIQRWTQAFKGLRAKGVRLQFADLAPSVVEHVSILIGFIPRSEILSIQIPFFCSRCTQETRTRLEIASLAISNLPLAPVQCAHCPGTAEFDDDPEHYFAFLRRDA